MRDPALPHERHLRGARIMLVGAALGTVGYAALLLHGDAARGEALALAVALWALAALLPLLKGRMKVGGVLETELREQPAPTRLEHW